MSRFGFDKWKCMGIVLFCLIVFFWKKLSEKAKWLASAVFFRNEDWKIFSDWSIALHEAWLREYIPPTVLDYVDPYITPNYLSLLTFIIMGIGVALSVWFIFGVYVFITRQQVLSSQAGMQYCQNRMTVEAFSDTSYTYNELSKLMKSPEFLALMEERKGKGDEAWNWQKRERVCNNS